MQQNLKRAVEWISVQKKLDTDKSVNKLIEEAAFRFDLSPKDSQFLYSFYKDQKSKHES